MKNIFFIILLLILLIAPIRNTFAVTSGDSEQTGADNSVQNIEHLIQNRTPKFISNPIITLVNGIEQFRVAVAELANKETAEIRVEVKNIESEKPTNAQESGKGSFKLLFKRILLF